MKQLLISFKIFVTILFTLCCASLWAQVSCTAKAPSEVGVGQAFRYQVVLNEKPSKIVSTGFSNFDVLNGPSQGSSSSISIVNGQMTQSSSYTYTYTLAAKKEGQFSIPGMVFVVNGNR